MGATYHLCPKREWFASSEKLDGVLVSFDNGHTCQIEGIGIVCIKLFDRVIRAKKYEVCTLVSEEFDFGWNFESAEPKRDSSRRYSQDVQ